MNGSWLVSPADDESNIDEGLDSDARVVFLDIEDEVGPEDKDAARENILRRLPEFERQKKDTVVRINGLNSGHCISDVESMLEADVAPDALMLPKAHSGRDVEIIADILDRTGSNMGIAPIIESPNGLFHAYDIATASSRVCAVNLGHGDLFDT